MILMLNLAFDFFCGKIRQRTLLLLIPLIFVAYFGTLTFAVRTVPGPFDWRYKSMSKLLYLRTDPELPALHVMVSIGIAVAGLLMIPFAGYVGRQFEDISPSLARVGVLTFGGGSLTLILAATLISQPDGGSSSVHELLARVCGFGLGFGMLAFYFCAAQSWRSLGANGTSDRRLLIAWSMIVPLAVLIAALRGLVALRWRWPEPIFRAVQNRALWHLGIWEWIGSGAVFVFLLSSALFLPEPSLKPLNTAGQSPS
jgi:hypothetical protein